MPFKRLLVGELIVSYIPAVCFQASAFSMTPNNGNNWLSTTLVSAMFETLKYYRPLDPYQKDLVCTITRLFNFGAGPPFPSFRPIP